MGEELPEEHLCVKLQAHIQEKVDLHKFFFSVDNDTSANHEY